MKKPFAIFTFLIFFFSQFGKVINFTLCTVATYERTSSFKCDCDKQLVAGTGEERKQAHSNLPGQQQPDDLFHLDNNAPLGLTLFIPATSYINGNSESLYNRYSNTIFHPPGQRA